MEFFDEDDKLVADILVQFSERVLEHERRTGFLPTWGSKALRSVLVNIPPPYKLSPPIVPRPSESSDVPRLPQSLPSSSFNPRPAPARPRLKVKSAGAKRMRADVPLTGALSGAEEAVNCGREVSECGMGMDRSNDTRPLHNEFLVPKETFVMGGASSSHLVEGAVSGGRQALECGMGIDGSNETRPLHNGFLVPKETFVMGGASSSHLVEGAASCGRQVLECGIGMDNGRSKARGFAKGPFIPNETFVMGYFIQFNKNAAYAEARKRRKLHMQRIKNPSRLCS